MHQHNILETLLTGLTLLHAYTEETNHSNLQTWNELALIAL